MTDTSDIFLKNKEQLKETVGIYLWPLHICTHTHRHTLYIPVPKCTYIHNNKNNNNDDDDDDDDKRPCCFISLNTYG